MKTRIILIICLITGIAVHLSANEKIYINREVTTHIVMPENIKMVDISTTKIIGNQCTDNIVRIKPYLENDSISSEGYKENELLGTLTIIGERHIAQYDILYTESPKYASTIYNVSYNETQSYINPEVSMPMAEIARYLSFSPFSPQSRMHIKRFIPAMKLNELYQREKNWNFKIQVLCEQEEWVSNNLLIFY